MPIGLSILSDTQADTVRTCPESQFIDVKGIAISPSKLTRSISAFANTDGGELYIGIREEIPSKQRFWEGFADQEAANGHLQAFETSFPLGKDFQYEFLQSPTNQGLVLHALVHKTKAIMRDSKGVPYVRRGAQNLPCDTPEKLRNLEYLKGITSFETEQVNASKEIVTASVVVQRFISEVVPTTQPEPWLRKQQLLHEDRPTAAGVLLFSDEPQAILPKRCGIKLYQYKTSEAQGFRAVLAFTPKTIEGCLYDQIKRAVKETKELAETIPKLGADSLETIRYPEKTLHEIITNAVIHRDYSVLDDVHIRVFENRIEVESPGRLPAHITVDNILDERFARNGAIVRILNKFPDAPNQDVGEGLNTAFEAMHELGLKSPVIAERENSVMISIKHELLASPEAAIMDYLEVNPTINNRKARALTHIRADHQMKGIFGRMVTKGMIEQVPGTRTASTAYRKKRAAALEPEPSGQTRLL